MTARPDEPPTDADWRLVRDDRSLFALATILFGPPPGSAFDTWDLSAADTDTHEEADQK